jgi:hypothetical protein
MMDGCPIAASDPTSSKVFQIRPGDRFRCQRRVRPPGTFRSSRTDGCHAAVFGALTLVLFVACSGMLPSCAGGGRGYLPFHADILSGDFVNFHCLNGTISLNSSAVCNHTPSSIVNIGSGFFSYTMTESLDSHFAFVAWSASNHACLGTDPTCGPRSNSSTVGLWGTCARGIRCGGAVFLNGPPQTITVRIYPGAGTLTLNEVALANGQSIDLSSGEVVTVSASITNSSVHLWNWESNDGSFSSQLSLTSNFTVGTNNAGVGNLSLVTERSSGNWGGFIARASGVTQASGVFSIPTVSAVPCIHSGGGFTCNPGLFYIWVGIGGVYGGDLWQAGFNVTVNSAGTESSCAWYEAYPNPIVQSSTDCVSGSGAAIYVEVSYDSSDTSSSYAISRCGPEGASRCWWNGTLDDFIPNQSSAEWVAEIVEEGPTPAIRTPVSFSEASAVDAGGIYSGFLAFPILATYAERSSGNNVAMQELVPSSLSQATGVVEYQGPGEA